MEKRWMYAGGLSSLQKRAQAAPHSCRWVACFAVHQCSPWWSMDGVAARAKPTEMGDIVTSPQDQGEPHEDRAAEGVSVADLGHVCRARSRAAASRWLLSKVH
jgi:hypothetical protein